MIRIRVAVVIVNRSRVLLVRHEKKGVSYWLLPGGGVESGEAMEAAAKRELLEETSLQVNIDRLLFVSETLAPGGGRHVINMTFLGQVTGGDLRVSADSRLKEARYFSAEEVERLDVHPPLQPYLAAGIRAGFAQPPQFLGVLWAP